MVGPDALVIVGEAALDQGDLGDVDGEGRGDLGLGQPELLAEVRFTPDRGGISYKE